MTGKYQPYPAYKDSGVEWLREMPKHWFPVKLAHVCSKIGGGTTPNTTENNLYYNGTIPWVTTGELRENTITDTQKKVNFKALKDYSGLYLHPKGSVVIAMYGATIGRLGILGIDATTNQACCVLQLSKRLNNVFLFYGLLSMHDEIVNQSSGGGQPNVSQEKISSLRLPCPSQHEQTQIARFLDHETAKIDTLIAKQEKLIELLQEKRQAVISHAVTKGLDPDVPMKDSGVAWLGAVPAHWKTCLLKHHSMIIDCKHITATFFDKGFPLASIGEVKGWNVSLESAKRTSEYYYLQLIEGGRKPRAGDIIFSRNATVGEAAKVTSNLPLFAMGQDVCLIRADEYLSPDYLLNIFNSALIAKQLELAMVGSTFKRVNVENIRNLMITPQSTVKKKRNPVVLDASSR
nr:restriction endonuclease subunit S [uncultured Desulfobacter sp.]